MLIAHLPAGYLFSRLPILQRNGLSSSVLAGSILPDLDMLWFHLVDHGHTHHHHYLTHRPMVWMAVLLIGLLWQGGGKSLLRGLGLGGFVHLALDSMAGAIDWGWPFFSLPVRVIEIDARFDWWVWSFMTHPSFVVEMLICLLAAAMLLRQLPFTNKRH